MGIQFNRRPYLSDWAYGCADFLAEMSAEEEPGIWADENFGRDWEGVPELSHGRTGDLRLLRRNPNLLDKAEFWAENLAIILQARTGFVFPGGSARIIANAAVDPNGCKQKRQHLARYLEKFASWFSEDFLLPRMISRLTGDQGCLEALQVLMDDLLAKDAELAAQQEAGEEDVRFWLWDVSEMPARFHSERAGALLRHSGVLRARSEDRKSCMDG